MDSPSRVRSALGRRDVLRLLALAPAAVTAMSGCGADSEAPDVLEALVRAAKSDAELAQSVARSHPSMADTANLIVSARSDHAHALQREIDRVDPPDPDEPAGPSPAAPDAPSTSGAATEALRTSLTKARDEAAELTVTLPTHRAGMVGSVSASCASLLEVLG